MVTMHSPVALRLMGDGDCNAARTIEAASHGATWPATNFLRELNENPVARYLVVESPRGITGFGGLWMQLDEAHVVNVAVEPSARGKGYGRLLVHGLVDLAIQYGMSVATLECRESNAVARRLYGSYGFYEVGRRKRYYSDGEDAVIMTTEDLSSGAYQQRLERLAEKLEVLLPGVSAVIDPETVPDLRTPAGHP